MADITIRGPSCDDDDEGERGERGERGKRGATGPTGPAGPTDPSRLIAAANVRADGVELSGFGIASIAHPAAGVYLLTLANPPASDDAVIPTALMKTTSALIKALPTVAGVIEIIIQQVDFVAIDRDFFIHVVDGT